MEVTLIVVTLVSIALAIAMGILTWRLLQEERLRSDARVAALEEGLAETLQHAYVTQSAGSPASKAAAANAGTESSVARSSAASSSDVSRGDLFTRDDTDWLAHFPTSTVKATAAPRDAEISVETRAFAAHDQGYAAGADDTLFPTAVAADDVAAATVVNANGGLFGQVEADDDRGGWSPRALAVAAVAVVMIGAVLAFWTIGRLMEPATNRPGTIAARAGANGAAPAALELMSLHQAMQDGTLTISGLVRNPHGGVPQERLTAVVFFFDGQGGFLSSTRAPLDYRALAPGDESPFQLSAPAPPGVARYRVSFRRDEGAVVPHVDRRQQVQQQQGQQSQTGQRTALGQPTHPGRDSRSGQQEASRS
jgi:hypothetical protein